MTLKVNVNLLNEHKYKDRKKQQKFTRRSGAQHASVVDPHGAVGAAHSQVVRHQRRDGYGGRCPSTVYQDVLKSKETQLGNV